MSNSWYTRVKGFLAGTKARGSDVRFEYDAVEDAFDLMPAPHSGGSNAGFSGAVEFEGAVSLSGGLGANASGADTYKLTNMIDGTADQDYATMANVAAEVVGGGTPGNIPITSLGVGTATANQLITINSGGTAVVGIDDPDRYIYPPGYITGLEVTSVDIAGDNSTDRIIKAGSCMAKLGDAELITLSSDIEKQFDTTFAEGDVAGGGSPVVPIGSGTGHYYYFLATKDSDGTVDVFGDTSTTGANAPSGWTARRRLGVEAHENTGKISVSGAITAGRRQIGDWVQAERNQRIFTLVNDSTLGAAETWDVSTVIPDNYKVTSWVRARLESTNTTYAYYAQLMYRDGTVSTGADLYIPIAAAGDGQAAELTLMFDQSENTTFYYEVGAGNPVSLLSLRIAMLGYYDHREDN